MEVESLIKKEMTNLFESLHDARRLYLERKYDEAIYALTDVIIPAGLLLQKNSGMEKVTNLEEYVLLAEANKLTIYEKKLNQQPKKEDEIRAEMKEIARGELDYDNPYYRKIMKTKEDLRTSPLCF